MTKRLTVPADTTWLMARVAALLNPYFEKDTPQGVRDIEAEDWAAELSGYPRWAVENAVRWWKSGENPNRRKRPLEGDISARVAVEMAPIKAAQTYLSLGPAKSDPEPQCPRGSAEQRAAEASAILAQAGFTPKRADTRPAYEGTDQ